MWYIQFVGSHLPSQCIPLDFVTPSNHLPNPPSPSSRISQPATINQQTQNARKHCTLRTPGWASSSRTHSPSEHPLNYPNFDVNTLRLRSSRQDHNPPLFAVRNGFQRQWSHHTSTRHQPDQRPACCTSSQTQQPDRHPQVQHNDQAHRLHHQQRHSQSDLQVWTREHFRRASQLFEHKHHHQHEHNFEHHHEH